MHFAREISQSFFGKNVKQFLESNKKKVYEVAIVGGSPDEPELVTLKNLGFRVTPTYFGIDQNSSFLDLNVSQYIDDDKFDLVLCNQVIEHVWNLENFFVNLSNLVKTGGLLWISCPASNKAHSSPEYYSAGFDSKFLVKNCSRFGFQKIASHNFGSERLYKMTHYSLFWPDKVEYRVPFFRGYRGRKLYFPLKFLVYLPGNLLACTWRRQIEFDTKFATEAIYLGIKLNDLV
jgi:SAM-dependent methyltransferase